MRVQDWWSIEVMDGEDGAVHTATGWREAYAQTLTESLITNGASSWRWFGFSWGVVLEVAFTEEAAWDAWLALPGTQATLDAVPDPVRGLLVHRGHGGSSGAYVPRSPAVAPRADRAALPEPLVS
ncbi:hypothetical protein [Streptomyces sp. NPDC049040]|uniref:hypothetical protein n=1 Tax=Streptomyces sp. NPDC049040 TaxID=3365593 RepID=UPI00371C5BAC